MKVHVDNDRLIITDRERVIDNPKIEGIIVDSVTLNDIILDIDIKELAKALKPYLDSIPNCECKK